jgi:hypothetical protein
MDDDHRRVALRRRPCGARAQSDRGAGAAGSRTALGLARPVQFPRAMKDWGAWAEEGRAQARRDTLWLLGAVALIGVLVLALVVVTA